MNVEKMMKKSVFNFIATRSISNERVSSQSFPQRDVLSRVHPKGCPLKGSPKGMPSQRFPQRDVLSKVPQRGVLSKISQRDVLSKIPERVVLSKIPQRDRKSVV